MTVETTDDSAVATKPAGQSSDKAVYRRILLKLSGEMLMGDQGFGINPGVVRSIASEIASVQDLGVEIAIVIGGGNIFRGLSASEQGMHRATADYMGMLATVINSLALQDALEKIGVFTRVQTAIEMHAVAEPYIPRRAVRHLEKGRVVVLAAGIGSPYFTTDTTAALRAVELGAEVVLKATKVDGIYTSDPATNPDATRYTHLDFTTALQQGLKVMDSTAFALCQDNQLPIVVFAMHPGNIRQVVCGQPLGTIVGSLHRTALATATPS